MRMIISDLDGTLLSKEKNISSFNYDILKKVQEKNIEIVVASGRDIYSIREIAEGLNIDYYICFNGAKIYKKEDLIYSKNMPKEICKEILKKGLGLNLDFSAIAKNNVYYSKMDLEYSMFTKYNNQLNFINIKNENEIIEDNFEKIVFMGKKENLFILKEYINKNFSKIVNCFGSGDGVLDIVSIECNKGLALKKLAETLNISLDKVIAFGDNENDISMLDIVKVPVIMENTTIDLKNKNYQKTTTNDENGVGVFLKNYFNL